MGFKHRLSVRSMARIAPQVPDDKSPVIEYLKQVHKDNLMPRFLPFKKLQETVTVVDDNGLPGMGTSMVG